jgi:hypothetical protein
MLYKMPSPADEAEKKQEFVENKLKKVQPVDSVES